MVDILCQLPSASDGRRAEAGRAATEPLCQLPAPSPGRRRKRVCTYDPFKPLSVKKCGCRFCKLAVVYLNRIESRRARAL